MQLPPSLISIVSPEFAATGGAAALLLAVESPSLTKSAVTRGPIATILHEGNRAVVRGGVLGVFNALGGRAAVGFAAVGTGVYAYDRYSDGKATRALNRGLKYFGTFRVGAGCE
jgi:hypothetical protein